MKFQSSSDEKVNTFTLGKVISELGFKVVPISRVGNKDKKRVHRDKELFLRSYTMKKKKKKKLYYESGIFPK